MRHNGRKVWYAVLRDFEDNDHSTGSFRKRAALREARKLRKGGYPDAHIALIDPVDDFCLGEIRDLSSGTITR